MSQSGALSSSGSGGLIVEFLQGNSGGPVGPDPSNTINVVGTTSTGISVAGNPATFTLTINAAQSSTTQFGTIKLATNAQAIAGTDTFNAITSDDLKAKLGTQTAHSLAVFEGTSSALTALGVALDGQLPIGSTGNDPVLANITAGTGISIVNGPGSITISVSGDTPTWVDSAGGGLSNHTGYFATAAAVYTLPAGVANGDIVEIADFVGGGVVLTAQNGDKIRLSNTDSNVNGTATSTQIGDSMRLVYRLVGKVWVNIPSASGMWILG